MKIVLFDVSKHEEQIISPFLEGLEVSFFEEKLTEENVSLAKDAEVLSVFINSPVSKNIIDSLPNLKLICARSAGFDHIDINYAKEKGIKVVNIPAYGPQTVAEFAFALLLALSRNVYKAVHQTKNEGSFDTQSMRGFDLYGKTIGVIGTGRIGKHSIKIAKGFGMRVLAYDLYPDQNFAKENDFEYKDLDSVLKESDIITLHAPYTKENYHLINKDKISLMKKGVYIINTARGELIDTEALLCGINDGIVAGAGLDVLEGERTLKNEVEILSSAHKMQEVLDYKTLLEARALIDMPNVFVTPHIAYYSNEAEREILSITASNIKDFIKGEPKNVVNN